MAEESKIWAVYIDDGTYKTKTFDRYLKNKSIPKNPKYRDIVRTTNYVLHNCSPLEPQKSELEKLLTDYQIHLDALDLL